PRDIGRIADPITELAAMSDGDNPEARCACRRQPGRAILDGYGRPGREPQALERELIGFGVRLDRIDVLLANDGLEGLPEPRGFEDRLDVLTAGAGNYRQADAAAQLAEQLGYARIQPRRVLEHAHGQELFPIYPFIDLVGIETALREQLGEELTVVNLRRPGRNIIGDLPAEDSERALPGGDVMVVR